jgi:FkbM family methyltransferase
MKFYKLVVDLKKIYNQIKTINKKKHAIFKFINQEDLVFDVGAHLGEKSKIFIENKIKTILIEPLPHCVKYLQKKYSNNKYVKIIQKGLGEKNSKKILMVNKSMPTISTVAKHWKKGRFSKLNWDHQIIIKITTLDNIIKQFGIPKYIKIDVEGYELSVLKGLTKKSGIISFEITSEYIANAEKCIKYLKKIGYFKFTFSIGERRKFFCEWLDSKQIINLVKKEIKKDKYFWGDIYCK